MCGRFTLQIPPELLAAIFGLKEIPVYPSRYNIAPTQQIAAVRRTADGRNRLDFLRWGLVPSWARDTSIGNKMINARSETVAGKPAFRHAIRHRRCLIPASGFYEWEEQEGKKLPRYVHCKDGSPMVFAGLWEHWQSPAGEIVESCTILTGAANRLIAPLHDRMPVILNPQAFSLWLDPAITVPEKLAHLYEPYPDDLLEMYPVSPQVNSPKIDSPDLLIPQAKSHD